MEHPENSEEYKGLTVNKGIEQPSSINPYLNLRKKPKRRQFTVGECETRASGSRTGGYRKMSAVFRQFYPCGYQWCSRSGEEYVD